ncbi:acyl-CoA carboxylase subunit beta [Sneathiella chinensis]|uniref:Acetyl-CoA carboxylase carboxyltransferase subunit n=1 Tax=Sneathiella chinensis TaxID=349750 RepID=A0ABQ5U2S9_9PROT|nr:carboxyl transferase domain-containing protein [Sneathiella chinensis]GLQ05553.1 acetyl-CoA carboxylase carboxyltransferase subunit [Sneathiella chinensis]
MPSLQSQIDTGSPEFEQNRNDMLSLLENVRTLEQKVVDLSGRQADRFHKAGKLLPRERIDALLDPGSSFLALSSLAGLGLHEDDGKDQVLGGCVITGIGQVAGTRVAVIASDSAIKGGTGTWAGAQKTIRLQQIAREQKLPVVNLVESGGGNLRLTHMTFAVLGGRRFANQARLSADGIPQVTVVHGSSTAGGAYVPGMSDYVIAVRNQAKMFLAGPPLLKMATGEIATDEELGGAAMHAEVAGTAEWVAEDDRHAISLTRDLVGNTNWPTRTEGTGQLEAPAPLYDPEELMGVVPVDYRKPVDVREIIARVADGSDFLEFKEDFDPFTICGWAHVNGYRCGIIGNNGPITAKGAVKAAQFIQLCDQAETPLVFLQNTTGFIVGKDAETAGIIKHGSKLIQAVTNARVPRITIMVGASFGAGNYAMCGRGYDPDFLFSWPNHRIAVMGGEQAAGVLEIVARGSAERRGLDVDEDKMTAQREEILSHYDATSSALYATSQVWDDGIIDPRDTRKILGECLAITNGARHRDVRPNTFGVARL